MKVTQKQWVIKMLKDNKEVTRNGALQNFISRLGAIACDIRKEIQPKGWDLVGFNRDGDYVYKLIKLDEKANSQVAQEQVRQVTNPDNQSKAPELSPMWQANRSSTSPRSQEPEHDTSLRPRESHPPLQQLSLRASLQ